MHNRPLLAGAAALALVLSLTACGDDGDEDTTDTTEAEASSDDTSADTEDTASDDTSAETDETDASSDSTEADTEDTTGDETGAEGDLSGLLVTPEDVGGTFVDIGYETSTEPGPCGTELDTEYPYEAIVGVTLGDEEQQLALQHEIRTYADEAAAAEVLGAAQDAFSCGASTTVEGLVLGEVTDVSADVGAEAAFLVSSTSEAEGVEGGIVVVQVGPVLSVYQFQGPVDVETGPDPVAIVSANVAAIQAELG